MNERPDNVAVEGRSATPQGRSPTPRTDALEREINRRPGRNVSLKDVQDSLEFARKLERELAAKQAEIDRLMLEFCPEDMTQEQMDEWAGHQMPAPFDDQYDADSAYG